MKEGLAGVCQGVDEEGSGAEVQAAWRSEAAYEEAEGWEGVRLTRMVEPASEEGGGREGAALSNALRKRRDGAVDSAAIRVVADEAGGSPGLRAATSGEEVKASTLEYLKQWVGWDRSFWFHNRPTNWWDAVA